MAGRHRQGGTELHELTGGQEKDAGVTVNRAKVTKPKNIDDYLEALSEDKRAALERVRKIIQAAAPRAEECISYQMPAFRLDGKPLIWLGAGAKHCAIYGVHETEKGEFADYDSSGKGTLRFPPANPPPAALITKLVRARIAKITG